MALFKQKDVILILLDSNYLLFKKYSDQIFHWQGDGTRKQGDVEISNFPISLWDGLVIDVCV